MKNIFHVPRWRWILDSLGERYWKRKFEKEFGYDEGRPNNLQFLYKPNHLVFLWAAGMIEGFSTYFKIKQRTVLVLQKKSQYFKKSDHDFIHQNMNNRLILIYVMEQ